MTEDHLSAQTAYMFSGALVVGVAVLELAGGVAGLLGGLFGAFLGWLLYRRLACR